MIPAIARRALGARNTIERVLSAVFIDSVWLHRYWHCHRLSACSFFMRGRQFHVCARCTGLILGLFLSPLALPLLERAAYVCMAFFVLNLADGLTQLLGWRTSTNALRLIFGLGFGLAFPLTLIITFAR